jgi:hypothetical protein
LKTGKSMQRREGFQTFEKLQRKTNLSIITRTQNRRKSRVKNRYFYQICILRIQESTGYSKWTSKKMARKGAQL